jgi:hypothetical protein
VRDFKTIGTVQRVVGLMSANRTTREPRWCTAVSWSTLQVEDGIKAVSGQKSQNIHIDRTSGRVLAFADTNGEPILANYAGWRKNTYHAEDPKNAGSAPGLSPSNPPEEFDE